MADAGDVIENPVTGERMTFRRTAADTGGAELVVELELRADAFLPAEHIHQKQEERFTVLDGRLLFRSAGEERLVTAGRERRRTARDAARVGDRRRDPGPGRDHLHPGRDGRALLRVVLPAGP